MSKRHYFCLFTHYLINSNYLITSRIHSLYHYLSLPLIISRIHSLYHYLSLPLIISRIHSLYHYLSLPLIISRIHSLYHYLSLPLEFTHHLKHTKKINRNSSFYKHKITPGGTCSPVPLGPPECKLRVTYYITQLHR